MWTVIVWLLLVEYPMICRAALATFDCAPLRGEFYLRADARQLCYDGEWTEAGVMDGMGTYWWPPVPKGEG